jgi:hypothetical protein
LDWIRQHCLAKHRRVLQALGAVVSLGAEEVDGAGRSIVFRKVYGDHFQVVGLCRTGSRK